MATPSCLVYPAATQLKEVLNDAITAHCVHLSWWLGVLSIVAAVVVKLLRVEPQVRVTAHTLFLVASTFFLCVLATRAMQKTQNRQ